MVFTYNNTTTGVVSTYKMNFQQMLDTIHCAYYIYNSMNLKISLLRKIAISVSENAALAEHYVQILGVMS